MAMEPKITHPDVSTAKIIEATPKKKNVTKVG